MKINNYYRYIIGIFFALFLYLSYNNTTPYNLIVLVLLGAIMLKDLHNTKI